MPSNPLSGLRKMHMKSEQIKTKLIEKRAHQRIPLILQVNFLYQNTIYTGTVTNISKNGMYIETENFLPLISRFEVRVPLMDEVMEVPVRVKRLVETDRNFTCMGVELITPAPYSMELLSRKGDE